MYRALRALRKLPEERVTRARVVTGLASLAIVIVAVLAWPFTVDDAFVIARYADRLADGHGYTMNDGPATDAVTAPLALVPEVIAAFLSLSPIAAGKLAGVAAMLLAVAIAVRRAALRSSLDGVVAAALCAVRPTLGIWGAAGLETGLAALALVLALEGVLAERRQSIFLFIGSLAIPWLRPELVPVVITLALFGGSARRAGLAGVFLGLGSVVIFRLALFGSPLPLAVQAKPPEIELGLGYAARGIAIVLGAGLVPLALALRGPGRAPAVAVIVGAAAIALAGGDWMPGFRLFAPLVPLFALASARALGELWSRGKRGWTVVAIATSIAVPAVDLIVQIPAAREAGRAREEIAAPLADWLHGCTDRVALVDVGYLGARSGLEVIDLGGITDPEVARLPGGHAGKLMDPAWLRERDPGAIVLHSTIRPVVDQQGQLQAFAGHPVERRVAAMPWVRAQMRVARVDRYAGEYWYLTLVPTRSRCAPR